MKTYIIILLLGMILIHAEESSAKVVYDLTTKDLLSFERKVLKAVVANKAQYESKLKELDIAFVIHGGAYRYFTVDPSKTEYKTDKVLLKNYKDLKKRIKSLVDNYDVEFYMCGAGMPKHGLDAKDIVSFVKVIPNANIGLIDKQNKGYAYIPIR